MQFEVKKDRWMTVFVIVPFVIGFLVMLGSFALEPLDAVQWPIVFNFIVFIIIGAFIWQIYTQSFYQLDQDDLRIKFGPFRLKVAYTDITDIKPSRNFMSGMALSFDRVAIYKRGRLWQLISPVDKDRFIKEVKKRAKLA